MNDLHGMRIHWFCWLTRRHAWPSEWSPVGHIEDAEWRHCRRGCGTGQMRYTS